MNPALPASRHPPDVPAKFAHLLEDPNVARWHRNLAQGSPKTAREYLRMLGIFLDVRAETPAQFIARGQRECEDILHDFVAQRLRQGKAGSSTDFMAAVVQSWMKWNDVPLRRAIKIPRRNYNPRVRTFHIPSVAELRRVLGVCNARQRMALGLIAYAGIRPGAMGNMDGSDGLVLGDLPDAKIEGGRLAFEHIPTRIVIREELSKAKHEYFTMIGPEGCEYIASYFDQRVHEGEKLTTATPLLPSQRGRFMVAESVGDLLRTPMRAAGLDLPPYIWRSFFNNRTLMAEVDGFLRDYRVFFMGHRGDMEHVYALRKKIGGEMLEQMRQGYLKAVPHLESRAGEAPEDPMLQVADATLRAGGLGDEAIAQLDLASKDQAQLAQILLDELTKRFAPKPTEKAKPAQQLVKLEQLQAFLLQGWHLNGKLAEDAYLIDAPG